MGIAVSTDGTVTLTVEQYDMLKLNSDKLHALEAGGVDNWEGYDFVMDNFAKEQLAKNQQLVDLLTKDEEEIQ